MRIVDGIKCNTDLQYLIARFVGKPQDFTKETSIGRNLLKKEPDVNFWDYVFYKMGSRKLLTLAFLYSAHNKWIIEECKKDYHKVKWKNFVEDKKKAVELPKQENITLSEEVQVDIQATPNRIKTLKDFLNYGKT